VRRPARTPVVLLLLGLLLAVSVVLSTGFGAEQLAPGVVLDVLRARLLGGPTDAVYDSIVWDLRVPRTLLALVVGAGLAIAGTGIQTLVRNPLADPYLLGVSSGASVGAVAVITSGVFAGAGIWALSTGALLGALAAALLVFAVATGQGGLTPLRLLLTGTVLGSAFSAIASYLVFRSANSQAAESVLFWLLGSLSGADWSRLALPSVTVGLLGVLLLAASGWLDALAAGPDTAASRSRDGVKDLPAVSQGRFLNLSYSMWTSGPLNLDAAEQLRKALESWGLAPPSAITPPFDDRLNR